MRLTDVVLRQGHLSEEALAEAIYTGVRPDHLDRCNVCAQRALELSRWLDEVRTVGVEAADEVFPPEKLAVQHAQILRRLEQIDEPARVIAFPTVTVSAPAHSENRLRRVAPAWVGVAAAAGLVIGVIGGQVTARLNQPAGSPIPAGVQQASPAAADGLDGIVSQPASESAQPQNASLMELNLEGYTPEMLQGIDEMVPKLVPSRYTVASAR